MPTKCELEQRVHEYAEEVMKLDKLLDQSKAETARFQRDAQREGDYAKKLLQQMDSIRAAVETILATKHGKSVEVNGDWINGEFVEHGLNDEVRFLRYVHSLTVLQPPF